jgi:hypothetical protein
MQEDSKGDDERFQRVKVKFVLTVEPKILKVLGTASNVGSV